MAQWNPKRPPLPPDWEVRRQHVFDRDQWRCQLAFDGICTGRAVEVDHIDDHADHRLINLQAVCHECHTVKTQKQSADGLRAAWARTRPRQPRHPGLL